MRYIKVIHGIIFVYSCKSVAGALKSQEVLKWLLSEVFHGDELIRKEQLFTNEAAIVF